MLRKNVAGQFVYVVAVKASDGTALTGATLSGYRSIDGAAQAAITGSITELANGQYKVALSQADTNGNDIGFLFTATGMIPVGFTVLTTAADPTNATTFGLGNLDAAVSSRSTYAGADTAGTTTLLSRLTAGRATALDNLDAAISGIATAVWGAATRTLSAFGFTVTAGTVSDKTGYSLAVAPPTAATIATTVVDQTLSGHTTAGTVGGAINSASSAGDPWSTALPGAYGAGTAGKILGDRLDATVSSRNATAPDNAGVAAIKAKTDNLPASPAATSDIPTANANADALLDRANAVETGWTVRNVLRVISAAVAGKLSGAATSTVTVRNVTDSKARITATVDADGNRSSVTLDGA